MSFEEIKPFLTYIAGIILIAGGIILLFFDKINFEQAMALIGTGVGLITGTFYGSRVLGKS